MKVDGEGWSDSSWDVKKEKGDFGKRKIKKKIT